MVKGIFSDLARKVKDSCDRRLRGQRYFLRLGTVGERFVSEGNQDDQGELA